MTREEVQAELDATWSKELVAMRDAGLGITWPRDVVTIDVDLVTAKTRWDVAQRGYGIDDVPSLRKMKRAGVMLKFLMDVDEAVCVGDEAVGWKGIVNAPVPGVIPARRPWLAMSGAELVERVVDDVVTLARLGLEPGCLESGAIVLARGQRAVAVPHRLRLLVSPPAYAELVVTNPLMDGVSLLTHLLEGVKARIGRRDLELEVQPCKWLTTDAVLLAVNGVEVELTLPVPKVDPESDAVTFVGALSAITITAPWCVRRLTGIRST